MREAVSEQKLEVLDKHIGKVLGDKYRLESEWRASGLGKVYHATHLLMDKPVAVKVLSPALEGDVNVVNRFSAEARAVSSLSHPNLLGVTDFGSDADGTVFIVFEDARGESVEETVKNEGKFSVERAVRIARQIASALSAARAKDITHQHLDSENILLTKNANGAENVKVLDFGAAQAEDKKTSAKTSARDLKYVAPEQLDANLPVDGRADIYSLGAILYEMLTGEIPFSAETSEELLNKQTQNPPPPFSAFRVDTPAGLEPIVLRALANNPEMRYQSVNEFADDLESVAKQFEGSELEITPNTAATVANAKNNMWKTAFVVLAGISLLAVVMIYATSSKQVDPQTQLQTDADSSPVQPLNPATGINEQNLVFSSDGTSPEYAGNSSTSAPNGVPGGDGYDPWARGGAPPPGAPNYSSSGQTITIPGNGGGSQFMPGLDGNGGIILIPVQTNSNTSVNPAATPKGGKNSAANTQVAPTPKDNTTQTNPETKTTPTTSKPEKTPTNKTAEPKSNRVNEPKSNPPATSNDKKTPSGNEQSTN